MPFSASLGGFLQGAAVILICGSIGGFGHVLAYYDEEDSSLSFRERAAKHTALGILAALIAYGVSGVYQAALWQQIATTAMAGVGGGAFVRSQLQRQELDRQKRVSGTATNANRQLVDLLPGPETPPNPT